jgi:UDP-glucose 4-epimerase
MHVLVTGGAGFIGSHTVIELLTRGFDVTVVDNFVNSKPESLRRVAELAGRAPAFVKADLVDAPAVETLFANNAFDAVIHFAGLKAVGESVTIPLRYYENNLISTLVLLRMMKKYGVKNLVFSSSATVYGVPKKVPITEDFPLSVTNPYGQTKLMIENILRDIHHAEPDMGIALLRYFNPIGAHKSGRIGEDPNGIPNNLMPYISQDAIGKLPKLRVFGNDYPTKDGTGVRDYIHVVDLANAHVCALQAIARRCGIGIYNVGTGHGYSVLDMVKAFVRVNGVDVPYSIKPRRAGDIATCYCNPAKAKAELGWEAKYGIDEMVRDSWNWQRQNPDGYPE